MRPCQPDHFTQVMNQEQSRLHIVGMRLSIDRKVNVHGDPLALLKISKIVGAEAITKLDSSCYHEGPTYQVPTEVRPERRTALAMRWLKTYARSRNEKSMSSKLASELISASNNEGSAVKKKEDTHKMAEANKAFAHFKW